MAFQQNFSAPTMQFGSEGDASFKRNWKSEPSASENVNGCFDCSICLDSAHDPVVTLCGHLYCWPCIYKWLQTQSFSFESDARPKCPVCKAYISTSSLVPLYGRGTSLSESESKKPQLDSTIPHRPRAAGLDTLLAANQQCNHPNPFQPRQPSSFHDQQYIPHPFGNYVSMMPSSIGSTATTSHFSPTVNMVGELVFPRMFRSSDTSLFAYPFPNSYPIPGNSSPRLRRQELKLDKSLNRVSIFLFCCFVLCLLLF
ncbi:E3 ubiquitin- ligase RMA3-like [Olea europaea subsp. europaea]|uniref:E3 ubiquitin-protein ligase RMA n=1 Tax=Olea europaea subsp. europaea TaxID=158383 RepID=A0A8S0R626_OLEEU|nr:E3 ubiquitin- ligase RMA3-like [Olea europaea subsp. europaea]